MKTQHLHRALLVLLVASLVELPARAQVATTASLPRGNAHEAGFSSEKLAEIHALIARAVQERKISGGAALIARRGKIVHVATAGMQDADSDAPIRESTIYRIASMTKPITSVAAMMLVEESKLRLDDPVAKFIPEFATACVLTKDAKSLSVFDGGTTSMLI